MLIAFLDEFGHTGPFVSRKDKKYNQSPVFGLAGYVIPHTQVREFARFFFKLKAWMLSADIAASAKHPATWEKKGSDLVTTREVLGYASIREGLARLLNKINRCGGKIIFYGRQKYLSPENSRSSGLYTTVLGHTIRAIDDYCCQSDQLYMMILDENSERKNLLETAAKTMFGEQPARCLLEPPFQVESHLYQTVQAADWIAAIVGKIAAYRIGGEQYADWEWANRLFGPKLRQFSTHSPLWERSTAQRKLALKKSGGET
jgi:hypothetical protein